MSSACKYGEEQLVSLLYEDGDADEMLELRAHLATCADCRAELEELASMKDMLSAWPNVANAPRMVYVHAEASLWARLRRWAGEIGGLGMGSLLKPAAAAATVVVVLALSIALLDVRVAPDGRLQIGWGDVAPAGDSIGDATAQATAPVSREEFQQGLAQVASYMEDLFRARSEEDRRLLVTMIDERMEEQGLAMSQQMRGAVDAALVAMDQQHQGDLGLVFSAIDELNVITASELQRMNTILASLVQGDPEEE